MYFNFLQIYSENFFNIYLHELKMFFQIFMFKVYRSVFGKILAFELYNFY